MVDFPAIVMLVFGGVSVINLTIFVASSGELFFPILTGKNSSKKSHPQENIEMSETSRFLMGFSLDNGGIFER